MDGEGQVSDAESLGAVSVNPSPQFGARHFSTRVFQAPKAIRPTS